MYCQILGKTTLLTVVKWTFYPLAKGLGNIPAGSMPIACSLQFATELCFVIKLMIFEWLFIVAKSRHTYTIIIQYLDMPQAMEYLGKGEVLINMMHVKMSLYTLTMLCYSSSIFWLRNAVLLYKMTEWDGDPFALFSVNRQRRWREGSFKDDGFKEIVFKI